MKHAQERKYFHFWSFLRLQALPGAMLCRNTGLFYHDGQDHHNFFFYTYFREMENSIVN